MKNTYVLVSLEELLGIKEGKDDIEIVEEMLDEVFGNECLEGIVDDMLSINEALNELTDNEYGVNVLNEIFNELSEELGLDFNLQVIAVN